MSLSSPLIALVENDLPTNRAFARLLRANGFRVETFVSAELLLARPGQSALDCMLLDIDLDGMSGLELQSLLKDKGDPTPIIFVTGRDDADACTKAHQGGCSAFLYKPVTAHLLFDAIANAISPH
jgi:FixJ family two-component response regulator